VELELTDDQRALQDAFDRRLRTLSTPERVRASEQTGFDAQIWRAIFEMGAVTMALDIEHGGGGAGLVDLALVCESQGRYLASVPLTEVAVATRLLARAGADTLLADVVRGDTLATIALRPAEGGVARLVPGGAVADTVVGIDGTELVAVTLPSVDLPRTPATLAAAALADRRLQSMDAGRRTVLAEGSDAETWYAGALSEWKTLTAAALVGVAQGALELGLNHARDRHQFGMPIGAFQTISHGLADDATKVDGSRLLAYEAAWAIDEKLPEAGALASMAFLYAAQTAQEVAARSLHLHGGYGFMLEYDIQLFFRRAKGWALVYGDPLDEFQALADDLFGQPLRSQG
jgi:alkylation response protein AidB-like acyl-CoA dehydrogenase